MRKPIYNRDKFIVIKNEEFAENDNNGEIGQTIEQEIAAALKANQPIDSSKQIIYTEKKEGVIPAFDHRTDRFAAAMESVDKFWQKRREKKEKEEQSQETTPYESNEK